ncbi:MDR/zinc-dependent alcohol dehydrogenase-like family protein [Roseivivax isoporae]|uniref:Zn-containing dehydrogenase n=1 Tax=Roseivivax isoporae LMG 25204 TaxID=1449351 RepID=X7F807_9RHOB|nr:zinc-binding dehydrogenase [Roseivivax isoporae]ETX29012.1 Zn-containing dehydrogenase [Roseivivax isoporae LMG 25204]
MNDPGPALLGGDRHPAAEGTPRAARLLAPGQIGIGPIEIRAPDRGEVRIRLEGTGVCASNLGPWAGGPGTGFPTDPGAPGHEGWGVVEAVGADVDTLRTGQRVAFLGGASYATHETVPAGNAVVLPPELDGQPFPGEPIGCAMNIFRRSRIAAGDDVAIVGIGFLGALLTRLASAAGARVTAISRRQSSLELAREMGAAEALPLGDARDIVGHVSDRTRGRLCDVAIEAVGAQAPLDLAADLVREGGRLVIAGYHQDGPRQVNMQLWNWRGFDAINAHERDLSVQLDGIRRGIAATLEGRIDPGRLLTHTYPLEDLDRALNDTRDKPGAFVKAVIACR